MRLFSIANYKGGTGKTTTVVNLAALLGLMGWRVLGVDLDGQCNATRWLGYDDDNGGILAAIGKNAVAVESLVVPTTVQGVDLLPGSVDLCMAEKVLGAQPIPQLVIKGVLDKLPPRWDVVLLDCPPAMGLLTISALVAAPEVVVPVQTKQLGLAGVAGLVKTMRELEELLRAPIRLSALLPCMYNRTTLSREVVADLLEKFPIETLTDPRGKPLVVRESTRLAEAPGHCRPINLHDPDGSGTEDYRKVANALASRWQLTKPTKAPMTRKSERRAA